MELGMTSCDLAGTPTVSKVPRPDLCFADVPYMIFPEQGYRRETQSP